MNNLANFTRRAVTTVWNPASQLKCYCSSPSPNNRLFVAGLSWSVDEKSLVDAFSDFGEVTGVRILHDKNTGRPKGLGFVNFSNGDDANSAREAMDGKKILGRPVRVSFAHELVRGAPIVVPHFGDAAAAPRRDQ